MRDTPRYFCPTCGRYADAPGTCVGRDQIDHAPVDLVEDRAPDLCSAMGPDRVACMARGYCGRDIACNH